jgi:hypothetical protein
MVWDKTLRLLFETKQAGGSRQATAGDGRRATAKTACVIPSAAPKARRRGIAILPVERLALGRDDCDPCLSAWEDVYARYVPDPYSPSPLESLPSRLRIRTGRRFIV